MSVKTWGDFEIHFDRVLGRGGMGAVYMGRQVSVDRPAAVKILKKELTENPEFVKRFQREAALLARLVDTHVVQVFGAGEVDGQHFYAMEFVEGEDLSQRLRRGYRFTPDEVLQTAHRVGKALQAAWRHKIVHRDIKPSNIVITRDNLIKVMDFGLAKNPETDLTQSEIIMGTAKYMSPEQATGSPCDIRSDLYSLGAVLYELATGKPPFVGETPTSVIYQHVHKLARRPREVNPSIPEALESLILRLMAKAPEDRYQSPDELIPAVKGIMEGVSPDERATLIDRTVLVGGSERTAVTVPAAAPAPAKRSSSAPAVVAVLAILAVLGVGGYFAYESYIKGAGNGSITHNPPPVPPNPPPTPPGAPPPAPPPNPPPTTSASAWKEPLDKGNEAMVGEQWTSAREFLERARDLGAPGLDEKIRFVRHNEHKKKGDDERDFERALQHYEAAQKVIDNEDIRRKIGLTSYRHFSKLAGDNEGVDWPQAATYWEKAIPHASEAQRGEAESRRKFSDAYARARKARVAGDPKGALALLDELAKDPRNWGEQIEKEREIVRKEAAGKMDEEMKRLRVEMEALVEAGRQARLKPDWAAARDAFKRASDARFGALVTDELRGRLREAEAALAAPAGTVYVPAGKFRMGGGRDIEAPEGEAETRAFYIDVREVIVDDYRAFLRGLQTGGHHPGCHKEEPPDKNHRPDRWQDQEQRLAEPIVGIDWWDAHSFAAWQGKRLPTEAEFEKAAGYDLALKRAYPWGNEFRAEGGRSFFGCDAMDNSVLEWTADWFDRYPWSAISNGNFGKKYRVMRGGYQLKEDAEQNTRTAFRHWTEPWRRRPFIGFRCVQEAADR